MEHASVAAFARFTLELLALGAPAGLVEASNRAADDELAHAEICFALASRFSGAPLGPGPLDIRGALTTPTLEGVLESVVREGCVGETAAALVAAEGVAHADDPEVSRALERIAEDETRHAVLAWRFVRWALTRDAKLVDVVERTLAEERQRAMARRAAAEETFPEDEATLLAHGVLSAHAEATLLVDALDRVVRPMLTSLQGETAPAEARPTA
jgi:hypothetical protein